MALLSDPVERTAAYRAVVAEVERDVETDLRAQGFDRQTMGYCHAFWPEKQRVLWERHGIAWKTPAEMNPTVLFD